MVCVVCFQPLYTAGVCLFQRFNRKQLHYTPSDDHIKSIQWIEARDRGLSFPFFLSIFLTTRMECSAALFLTSKAE